MPPPTATLAAPAPDDLWRAFHAGDYQRVIAALDGHDSDRGWGGELNFLMAQSLHNGGADPRRVRQYYLQAASAGFDRFWVRLGLARLEREADRPWRSALYRLRAFVQRPLRKEARALPVAALRDVLWAAARQMVRVRDRVIART